MAEASGSQHGSGSQWRIAVAIALAVVLAVLLLNRRGDQSGSSSSDPHELDVVSQDVQPVPHDVDSIGRAAMDYIPLDEALRHDPFAVPRGTATGETAEVAAVPSPDPLEERRKALKQLMESMRGESVGLLLRTSRGPAALLRGKIVHEGDVIEGLRVVKIGTDGVVLGPPDQILYRDDPLNPIDRR